MTFIRYVLVQLIAYCIDLGGFLLLLKAEFEGPIICNVFAKVSAGVFSFVLHRSFTFREEKKLAINHQVIRYFLLLALNIPFSSALFAIALLIISESVIAKLIADIVSVALTYALSKRLIFVENEKYENNRW